MHARFRDLPRFLRPGDLVVVNTSGTRAAAIDAVTPAGERLVVHLSNELPAGLWLIEVRRPAPNGSTVPADDAVDGTTLSLPGGGAVHVHARFPGSPRLWLATLDVPGPLNDYLARHGRAIRYGYVGRDWPLSAYQTVYATEPGSAEMPSAGPPVHARGHHSACRPRRRRHPAGARTPACPRSKATSCPTRSTTGCRPRPPSG